MADPTAAGQQAITEEAEHNDQPHWVYIIACRDGTLYTGYATNVERRVATHNAGKGAKYTRSRLPVSLQASWSFASKGEALRAEYLIKRLSRAQKWHMIAQGTFSLVQNVENVERKPQ